MLTLLIRSSLVLLVCYQFLTPAEAFWNRNSYSGGYYSKGHTDLSKPKTVSGYSAGLPSQNATRKGLGISAWGIVILTVAIILAGVVLYYFSICYSICQPSKGKYDKMGIPTIA